MNPISVKNVASEPVGPKAVNVAVKTKGAHDVFFSDGFIPGTGSLVLTQIEANSDIHAIGFAGVEQNPTELYVPFHAIAVATVDYVRNANDVVDALCDSQDGE